MSKPGLTPLSLIALNISNTLWLWAVPIAVGVPLFVHLFGRRSGRVVVLPTARFVRQAVAGSSPWLRLRNGLLLLLRCVTLTLLVVGFARPVWYGQPLPVWADRGVSAVLVLDRSASMTRSQNGVTLFDEAKRRVVAMLRGLDPQHDLASVVLLDAAPRPLLPQPSANFSRLIELVGQTQVTHHHGDTGAAMRVARDVAARGAVAGDRGTERQGRIEIFTDVQASQFENSQLDLGGAEAGSGGAGVRVHKISGGPGANLALLDCVVTPTVPVVGQQAVVTARVAYFAEDDSTVHATVVMDFEGRQTSKEVTVKGGATQAVEFVIHPRVAGISGVQLAIGDMRGDDVIDLDNRVGSVFRIEALRRVALVTAADINDPDAAAYYFVRALQPGINDLNDTGVGLEVWGSSSLVTKLGESQAVRSPVAVIIVEAGRLTDTTLRALHRFLIGGGAVVWVIDSEEAIATLRRAIEIGTNIDTGLNPVVPSAIPSGMAAADLRVESGRFDDPVLRVFEGPARGGLLRTRFGGAVACDLLPMGEVLLEFSNGWPLLACRWVGAGRIAVLTAGLSPTQSDLVKGPYFVPLIHQLIRHLTPGAPPVAVARPGDVVSIPVDHNLGNEDRPLIVVGPQGQRVMSWGVRRGQAATRVVRVGPIDRVGRYVVTTADRGNVLGGVSVQLDPAESDPRALDRMPFARAGVIPPLSFREGVGGRSSIRDLRGVHPSPNLSPGGERGNETALTGGGSVTAQRSAVGVDLVNHESAGLRPQGVELWPYLIAAAVVLVTIEMLIADWLAGLLRAGRFGKNVASLAVGRGLTIHA